MEKNQIFRIYISFNILIYLIRIPGYYMVNAWFKDRIAVSRPGDSVYIWHASRDSNN